VNIYAVRNRSEYQALCADKDHELTALHEWQGVLTERFLQQGPLYIEGRCWPLKAAGRFLIDDQYSEDGTINWRERLVCEQTGLNNRVRGAMHVFEQWATPDPADPVYLTEQHSALYRWLKKRHPKLTGSEFLADTHWLHRLRFAVRQFPERLQHQDLTQLTFTDHSFQSVLTFDCLEHIPDYPQALREMYRVLRHGGQLFVSVPFDVQAVATLTRARLNDDQTITHLMPPEYHGNPVNKQGSLCYYHFGWDLLPVFRSVGFQDAAALMYWSEAYAYLGGPQLLLWAAR
jgi:SAM-dependent methyltransferase